MYFIPINALNGELKSAVASFIARHEVICMGLTERFIRYSSNNKIAATIYAVFIKEVAANYLFGVVSFGAAITHCLPFIDVSYTTSGVALINDFSESFITLVKNNHADILSSKSEAVTFGVNGEKFATDVLRNCFIKLGAVVKKENDYHLMTLDARGVKALFYNVPRGMSLLKCNNIDKSSSIYKSLIALHTLYESEEIQLPSITANGDASRVRMNYALQNEIVWALTKNNIVVSKAQTNAICFSHAQLGGVCTIESMRGNHCAKSVMAALIIDLAKMGKLPVLYVKKTNTSALFLYNKLGFTCVASNKIVYF